MIRPDLGAFLGLIWVWEPINCKPMIIIKRPQQLLEWLNSQATPKLPLREDVPLCWLGIRLLSLGRTKHHIIYMGSKTLKKTSNSMETYSYQANLMFHHSSDKSWFTLRWKSFSISAKELPYLIQNRQDGKQKEDANRARPREEASSNPSCSHATVGCS
jgi:hypothetical protein